MFKRKLSFKGRLVVYSSYMIIIFSVIIFIYLYIGSESTVAKPTTEFDTINTSYSKDFRSLVDKIGSGNTTGIPSYDDKTVTYGDKINITKGSGDFSNFRETDTLDKKSVTWFNSFKGEWNMSITAPYFVNELLLKECVDYEPGGVVKLFDRYIFVAIGTYWADKFGFTDGDRGKTYRIYLSSGTVYDVICVDTKSSGDELAINSPSGKSIAHKKSEDTFCVTEFYIISHLSSYPIREAYGSNPEINYESTMKHGTNDYVEGESTLANKMGDFNNASPFKGEVIAVEVIKDYRVEELLDTAIPAFIEKYGG